MKKFRSIFYQVLSWGNIFFAKAKHPSIIVLSYHSISDDTWQYGISLSELKKQITYLQSTYEFISLTDLHLFLQGEKTITKPSVILTFDDGYADVLSSQSYFEDLHIYPALFVLSNTEINREQMDNNLRLLTTSQIVSLHKSGWIIGSHGATHAELPKCSADQLSAEIIDSKRQLEQELGIPIQFFAYPKGEYNAQVVDLVRKSGYKLALSMDEGIIYSSTNPFAIPRISVDRTHNFSEFQAMITPLAIYFRQFLKRSGLGRFAS